MARHARLAFLGVTAFVTLAALIGFGPYVPALVTAVLGTAASVFFARFARVRSDVVAGVVILMVGLCFIAWLTAVVYLAATGGLH